MALEDVPTDKKQIAVTRSFGRPVKTLEPLLEAVSEFASRAAENLRKQRSFAGQLYVFAHSSPFRPPPQFSRGVVVPLRRPTADTSILVQAASVGVRRFYEDGYQLQKAGVILLDLASSKLHQGEIDLEDLEPYRQVIAADLDAEIVKARYFEDGSVWRGLVDHARVLGEQEIREALLFSGGYARKLLPPFENIPK